MPFQISWRNQGVEWQFTGRVTGAEIIRTNMEIYGDGRFDDLDYQIVDFSNIDEIQITEDDVKKIAYFDMAASKSNPDLKVAIISQEEKLLSYIGLYAAYMQGIEWDIHIFQNRKMAVEWLQLKDTEDFQV